MLSLWYFSQGAQNISRLNFSQVQTEPLHGGGIRRQKPRGELRRGGGTRSRLWRLNGV